MKSRGVQEKSLEEILQALMDESCLLCPVHQRRIEFLNERRNNSSHSDFLQRLEESIELIEFDTLTKESLVSHIFLEESDYEIQRITTELLAKNLRGNLDEYQPSGAGDTRSTPTTPNCPLNLKWPTGSGKRLNLMLFDPPINFR